MENLVGKTIGSYRILEQIGVGGMATVFKAYQPALDRDVAVKILPAHLAADPTFFERFRREARAVARLEHPHILPIYDFGQEGSLTFLVMRCVTAGTLKQVLGQPLDLARIVNFITQIAGALDHAHEHGIVHRDVKPSNVLLDKGDWALLTDFGVARMMEGTQQLTATGVGIGTPAYMSPEQGMGKRVDRRSDVYSLGVMLYEMLVGKVPFEAETPMAVVYKHINDPLPLPRALNPAIPEAVERVVLKAVAKDPDDRFQTAGDLAKALEVASRAAPISIQQAPEAVSGPLAVPGLVSTKAIRGAAILIACVALGGLGVAAVRGGLLGGLLPGPAQASPTLTPVPTLAPAPTKPPMLAEPTLTPVPTEAPLPTRVPEWVIGMLTDVGGIDDNSFNATAWKGIQDAQAQLGVEGTYLEAGQPSDYAENIQHFLDENVDLVVTVGFSLGVDTGKAALDNPEQKFAIVDYSYPDCWPGAQVGKDCGADKELPNVLGLKFAVDQAAFLVGYLSADVTKTGKVGTYGGANIPSVTDFMDGFALGVELYNQKHGADVVVLGWNPYARTGSFAGNFVSTDDGRRLAQSLMQQGADIIMPVAGPMGGGSADAIQEAGGAYFIGVDTDWAVSAPEYADITLTSVQKRMDVAVFEAIRSVVDETFAGGTYVGTLADDGVGIAPFHQLDSVVPDWLRAELEVVRQSIMAGETRTKP